MENTQHNFWLYFKASDRTFSHSCNVRHPPEHVVGFIEVGANENLPFGWNYSLSESGEIVKGTKIPPSPLPGENQTGGNP